jgi:hypothetical protein
LNKAVEQVRGKTRSKNRGKDKAAASGGSNAPPTSLTCAALARDAATSS